jgi:tetratricopeptide (TPR) repeat protein
MVKQNKLALILFIFISFCLSLSHAQSSESILQGVNILPPKPAPTPAPARGPTPAPATTPTTGSTGAGFGSTSGAINPQTGLVDAAVTSDSILAPAPSPGKFEEYQSICRTREFDKLKYQSKESFKAKVAEHQQRAQTFMAQTSNVDLQEGYQILRDLLAHDEMTKFKELLTFLRRQKLSQFDNDLLAAFTGLSVRNMRTARESLMKALENDPKNEFVLINLAEVFLKELNFFEASAIYEDLNKIKKNNYLVELCESMVLNSLNADGEKVCLQAAKKFPDNPYPLIFAGITHRERETMPKASNFFKRSLNVKATEMGYTCLAELSLIDGKPEEAIQYFKLSLEQSPMSPRALLGLAWTEIKNRDFNSALETFKKACKVSSAYEVEVRKAYKKLSTDKVAGAEKFMQLAQSCSF